VRKHVEKIIDKLWEIFKDSGLKERDAKFEARGLIEEYLNKRIKHLTNTHKEKDNA